MDNDTLWDNFLSMIHKKTNPVSFNTWFSNLRVKSVKDGKIVIIVPMEIHKKVLSDNYYNLIEDTLNNLTGMTYDIDFVLKEDTSNNLEKITNSTEEKEVVWSSNLIKSYTFDNFIVGDSNRFAKTAAIAVAEQPGKVYNPLFIYGKSGLGKTHLMHAIGNYIVQNSNKKVLYTTSDTFMNEYTGLSKKDYRDNNLEYAEKFKNKYRNIDVLIIDDIQYLVGAEKTQQEFFHTFNALHQSNKQIIISSDRSPDDLKKLEERLRSRFTWGLPVDIYPPDFDLRCRILKNKIKNLDIFELIDDEVIEYIANTCDNDVRYLEGAITRICAYAAMTVPKRIDLEFANEALKDYINKDIFNISGNIQSIQNAVCEYFNISIEELKSKKRGSKIAYQRQIAMYLSRNLTDESFPKIGLEFGGRDHSTVIHACEKIEKNLKSDNLLKNDLKEIKNKIKC